MEGKTAPLPTIFNEGGIMPVFGQHFTPGPATGQWTLNKYISDE